MKFRALVIALGFCFGVGGAPQALADVARGQLNKLAVRALPVMPWLVVGVTKANMVAAKVQNQKLMVVNGTFAHTGGPLINLASPIDDVFPGETGLRLVSMGFEQDQKLAAVTFLVERGCRDKDLEPLIRRIAARYSAYAAPIRVGDNRGDNGDWYVLFDLGRFTVEIAVPEDSKRARVVFATREIYESMRHADGTADLLLPKLAPN